MRQRSRGRFPAEDCGIAVFGALAAELVDEWAESLGGSRSGPSVQATLAAGVVFTDREVRLTVWDLSSRPTSLLPMFATRCHVIVLTKGAATAAILEEMVPTMPTLAVVAAVGNRPATGEVGREAASAGAVYCERKADLALGLIATKCTQLRRLLNTSIGSFALVGEARVAYYEVRCSFGVDSGWVTPRRYSEFDALRRRIGAPPLPPARRSVDSLFARAGLWHDPAFLEKRRAALEIWLEAIVETATSAAAAEPILAFLDPAGHLRDALARLRTRTARRLQDLLDR